MSGTCCYCGLTDICRTILAHVGHRHPDHSDRNHQCLIYWKCDGKKAP